MNVKTIKHVTVDIHGVLASWPLHMLEGMLLDQEGQAISAQAARDELTRLAAEGVRYLPVGTPCDGFSHYTGCPGHAPTTDEPIEAAP